MVVPQPDFNRSLGPQPSPRTVFGHFETALEEIIAVLDPAEQETNEGTEVKGKRTPG